MRLEIIQMKYLYTLKEADYNQTAASMILHISQPALSKAISQIESELGFELFLRHKKRLIGLTEPGEKVFDLIDEILKKYQELELIIATHQTTTKTIKLGAISSYPQTLLKDLLSFEQEHKGFHIDMIENGGNMILTEFLKGEYDFALLVGPIQLPEDFADVYKFHEDEIAAFLPANHPLCRYEKLTWQQISTYPIISLSEKYRTHEFIREKFAQEGLVPNFAYESSSWQYLIDSVHDIAAITLMPSETPIGI